MYRNRLWGGLNSERKLANTGGAKFLYDHRNDILSIDPDTNPILAPWLIEIHEGGLRPLVNLNLRFVTPPLKRPSLGVS
jgi:hypothetical protein